MTPSTNLLDELVALTKKFTEAYWESNDPNLGVIAAALNSVAGAVYGDQYDLLTKFSKDLADTGLKILKQKGAH